MVNVENEIKIPILIEIGYITVCISYIIIYFMDIFMGIQIHRRPGDPVGEIFFILNLAIYLFVVGFVLFAVLVLSSIKLFHAQINKAITYGVILCIYTVIDYVVLIYNQLYSLRYILSIGILGFVLLFILKYRRRNQLSKYALEVRENKIMEKENDIEEKEKILKPILAETHLPIQDKFSIYICYAEEDAELFKIKEVANILVNSEEIRNVLYPQPEIDKDVLDYMDENLKNCDLMLLFCSPNVIKSKPTEDQWTEAEINGKPIIPVFVNPEHIPNLLRSRLGIEYDVFDINKNISNLKDLIFKKLQRDSELNLNEES
ncbi:MAG: toll/interleukin-1 receptor domain-containing protein [Candidatus Hermodarchaeota archaeon]